MYVILRGSGISVRFELEAVIPVRVLVVDDSEIVRMGVRVLLYDSAQWEICGEAENGADAIAKVLEESPDVVVLDLIMLR